MDRDGNVYFLDTGSGLWKFGVDGKLTQLSRSRFHWLALDESDRFAKARLPSGASGDIERAGESPTLLISSDYPIVIGSDGKMYYASGATGAMRMMGRSLSGAASAIANLPSPVGMLTHINGIASGPERSIYYTEDNAVRRINARGVVSTVATVTASANGPRIPGNDLRPYLRGLAVASDGTVYVASSEDGRLLKITPDGKVATILQTEGPWSPTAVAVSGEDVYVLEYLHTPGEDRLVWLPRVRKITPDGRSTIIVTIDQMPGARERVGS